MISDIDSEVLPVGGAGKSVVKIISYTFLTLVFCISCSIDPAIESDDPNIVSGEKGREAVKIPVDIQAIPDAVPKHEKRTRAGNPGKYIQSHLLLPHTLQLCCLLATDAVG